VRWCTQIARNLSETRSTPLRFSSTTETIDSESRSTKCSRRRVWRSFAPRGEPRG
jgi:hypothetical protein